MSIVFGSLPPLWFTAGLSFKPFKSFQPFKSFKLFGSILFSCLLLGHYSGLDTFKDFVS
jgi:hypothetical protein